MKFGFALVLCIVLWTADALALFDSNRWYRLRNVHLGEGRSLDTYSDGNNDPFMGRTGNYTGQRWRFTPIGGGQYRITNDFLGECRSLDTYGDSENRPFMGQTGSYSGQMWLVTPDTSGRFRLTNIFLGAGRSLDTYSGTVNAPFMGRTGNNSGQLWGLTPLDAIVPNSTIPILNAGSTTIDKSEGPTDFGIYLHAAGTRRIGMVFVDFSDAAGGTTSTADVAKHILGDGAANAWFQQRSYGRFSIEVTRKDGWRRMPQPSTSYEFLTSAATHRHFFADAASLFSDFDLSTFDVAWVVAANNNAPGMALSPTLNLPVGQGARAPTMAGEIRLGVSFGKDSYTNDFLNGVHELLHVHGLPDLYTSARFANVGAWDVMSDIFQSPGLLGWHRHKLGWLDVARKAYQSSGSRQHTLSPLDGNCGTSMIVVPIDSSRVFGIEIAQPFQNRNGTRAPEGVLIYRVDATIATGLGPVVVPAKDNTPHPTLGPKANAPFGAGDTFRQGRLTVRVMNKMGSFYRVQIDVAP